MQQPSSHWNWAVTSAQGGILLLVKITTSSWSCGGSPFGSAVPRHPCELCMRSYDTLSNVSASGVSALCGRRLERRRWHKGDVNSDGAVGVALSASNGHLIYKIRLATH